MLAGLHSLIKFANPSRLATDGYSFYHKSLFDFLDDPHRCGKLHVGETERDVFIWEAFLRSCSSECALTLYSFFLHLHVLMLILPPAGGRDTPNSMPQGFLGFLAILPTIMEIRVASAHSGVLPTPASADWWASMAITRQFANIRFGDLFSGVHNSVGTIQATNRPNCSRYSR